MFTALIMAGGEGKRLRLKVEKPLVKIGGTTMLERTVSATQQSKMVRRVIVACSPKTPRTISKARSLGLEVIVTPAKGYVHDLRASLAQLKLTKTVVVSSDLPLINHHIIDRAIWAYERSRKKALTVVARRTDLVKLGLKPRYARRFGRTIVVPVGINVIDGSRSLQRELDEAVLEPREVECLVNVNTKMDLRIARVIARRGKRSLPPTEGTG